MSGSRERESKWFVEILKFNSVHCRYEKIMTQRDVMTSPRPLRWSTDRKTNLGLKAQLLSVSRRLWIALFKWLQSSSFPWLGQIQSSVTKKAIKNHDINNTAALGGDILSSQGIFCSLEVNNTFRPYFRGRDDTKAWVLGGGDIGGYLKSCPPLTIIYWTPGCKWDSEYLS